MNKRHMRTAAVLACIAFIALTGTWLLTACDKVPANVIITVTPESSSVAEGDTVLLSAAVGTNTLVLLLPLEWAVSDPSVGAILQSAGVTAVYVAIHGSNNVVTVKDQGNAEGQALITRVEPEPEEEEPVVEAAE